MTEQFVRSAPAQAATLVGQVKDQIPWLAKVFGAGSGRVFPGASMADRSWLADRLHDTQVRWDCQQNSVNATLWWYAAAYRLVGTAVTTALVTGNAVIWRPEDPVWLRPNGYLGGFHPSGLTPASHCGAALARTLTPVVEGLSQVGRLPDDILWGLCADGIASRSLTAAEAGVPVERCSAFAVEVTKQMGGYAPVPLAQFLDETPTGESIDADAGCAPAEGAHRKVRRIECCKLHRTRDHDHCSHCPRRRNRVAAV